MAQGVNRIVRSMAPKSELPDMSAAINSTISLLQGDLCVIDSGTKLVRAIANGDTGSSLLGISVCDIVSGKLRRPYSTDVDASQAASAVPGPAFGVVAKLVLKTGDAAVAGQVCYPDAASGTHHVSTSITGMQSIGILQQNITSASAGQEVEVELGCRHPDNVLKL